MLHPSRWRLALTLTLTLSLLASLWPGLTPSALAAGSILVNSTGDQLDNGAASCTLREALDVIANLQTNPGYGKKGCTGAAVGANSVTFSSTSKITLADTLPYISSDVTISGPVTLEGAPGINAPLLRVAATIGAKLSISNMTLTKGRPAILQVGGVLNVAGVSFTGNNGDTANGGAINSTGTLNIAGSTFSGNRSDGPDGGGAIYHSGAAPMAIGGTTFNGNSAKRSAGAVYAAASAEIADSVFNGNIAEGLDSNNNGVDNEFDDHFAVGGGAIYAANDGQNGRKLTIVRSVFNGNLAAPRSNGGGLYNAISSVTEVRDSAFNGNIAGSAGNDQLGGAIINAGGILSVNRATLLNNSVTGSGGGLSVDRGGSVNLTNATLVANVASVSGGGIYAFNTQQNGSSSIRADLRVRNATIAQNVAPSGGGIYAQDPSSPYPNPWRLVNTILAANTPANCAGGDLTSEGYNLDSGTSCALAASGDLQSASAALEAPAFNGGPLADLLTMKLGPSSDALDGGSAPVCSDDPVGGVDQRGTPRGGDGDGDGTIGCDIGAYEGAELVAIYSSTPVAPGPIDIGNVQIGTTGQASFSIQNAGTKSMQLSAEILGGPEFAIVIFPSAIGAGAVAGATVSCTPSGAAGQRTATLKVTTSAVGTPTVSYTLLCNGTAAPVAGFGSTPEAPGLISIAPVLVGQSKSAALAIRETGNATLSVSAIQISGPNAAEFSFNTASFSISDGGAQVSRLVTCTPTAPGVRTATLSMSTNDPTLATATFTLNCLAVQPPGPLMQAITSSTGNSNPYGLALSPDGRNLYAASVTGDELLIFDRSTSTGALSNRRAISFLDGIIRVMVSPDGSNVYATLGEPDTVGGGQIRAYARDLGTGDLTFLDSVGEGAACGACGLGVIRGLGNAYGMALSPDGAFMYVSGVDNDVGAEAGLDNQSIIVLRRSADGGLAGFSNAPNYVTRVSTTLLASTYDLALSPDGAFLYAANYGGAPDSIAIFARNAATGDLSSAGSINAGTVSELNGVFRIAFSPDGSFAYASSYDSDALVVLRRNPISGALSHVVSYTQGGVDELEATLSRLDAVSSAAVSADGRYLFVTAFLSNAVTIFERDQVSGRLTRVQELARDAGTGLPPLAGARDVVVSADLRSAYATGYSDGAVVRLAQPNPKPALSALLPASVTAGSGALTLTLSGEGFVPGAEVGWVQGAAGFFAAEYVSPSELRFAVPSGWVSSAGVATVSVRNPAPGGGTSNSLTFTISAPAANPVPAIEQLAPGGAVAGEGPLQVSVGGAGFIPGSKVRWNGAERVTTYVGPTALTVQLTAADLAQPGVGAVTVLNGSPGGGSSNAVAFEVVAPFQNPPASLVSISPASAVAGQSGGQVVISLYGGGFAPGAQARWDGIARPTTFVSEGELRLELSAAELAEAGMHSVDAVNPGPGGGASAAQAFTIVAPSENPVPSVGAVQIAGVNGNGTVNLRLVGGGFVSGAQARWNGATRATSFVSATEVSLTITAADLALGQAAITVENPGPGGGLSNERLFAFYRIAQPFTVR